MTLARPVSRLTVLVVAVSLCLPVSTAAQSLDGAGLVSTGLLLRQMDGVKRVLMIGAHPDDEDTGLLTVLARGQGAETAYLSLTRGDGGQNLIGPELWEGLGVIRTGELEGARSLDGGRQFFTRAVDYGYSKTADEALRFWDREELLRDVTWVVRTFRPHVIVSVFSGTPADGHGQHQAAGIMAREVFAASGDPSRFPEQIELGLEAWQPDKFYQSSRRRFFGGGPGSAGDGSEVIQIGDYDALLGRSLFQLSMESRSQHRSQNMGAPQPFGPRNTGVVLVESRVGGGDGIFAGVDTTLASVTRGLPEGGAEVAMPHLDAYRAAVGRARAGLGLDPGAVVPDLAEAFEHLVQARREIGQAATIEFAQAIDQKQRIVTRAVMAAAGIVFDIRSNDDLIVPGQTVELQAQLWNGGTTRVITPGIQLLSRSGWQIIPKQFEGLSSDASVAPGTLATWTYDLTIPADADPTRLYFLREDRNGAVFEWPADPGLWGLPRDPSPLEGAVTFRLALGDEQTGTRMIHSTPWRYVGVDPARGEFEKTVLIVPPVSVSVEPGAIVWPTGEAGSKSVTVVVRSETEAGASGSVSLEAPTGWTVSPRTQPFGLDGAAAERSLSFEVSPDGRPQPGDHTLRAVATTSNGASYDEGFSLIDYDHVPRTAMYSPSATTVTVVPVEVPAGLTVGYVMGSGDTGPEAIRQMGAAVEVLDADAVREGDFGRFDAVVLGVRAYEVREDLQAASAQLLDYARAGGVIVAQYNRGPLGNLAPHPITVGRGSPRVSDETAPITILDPGSPIFSSPNAIGPSDFDGWVQERGLYFAAEWDDRYVPQLELNDPGEEPRHGSLLVTRVGEGAFVYTALSFFRQWNDRVPGAFRLFANLISLDPSALGSAEN